MTSELFVLNRVVSVTFYQRNAGFFLVIGLLLFGIPGHQAWPMHKAIMYEIAGSWAVWLTAAFVWLVYALKCLHFGMKTLSMPENEFLYTISLLPVRQQLTSLFLTQCSLYLPVWGYALVTTGIALRAHAYETALATLLFNGLACLALAYASYRKINFPNQDRGLSWLSRAFRVRFPQPFPAFYWSYLLHEEKMLLLSTKAFSLLLLSGVFPLYASVDHDARMLWIAYLLSACAHVIVAQQLRAFEDCWLLITRNLPFSIPARFGRYLLVYFVVLVPEMLTLGLQFSSTFRWTDWTAYTSLALGICLGSHCLLYLSHQEPKKFVIRVFFAFIFLFLLVMYRISPHLQALALLALSYGLMHRYYYRYEP